MQTRRRFDRCAAAPFALTMAAIALLMTAVSVRPADAQEHTRLRHERTESWRTRIVPARRFEQPTSLGRKSTPEPFVTLPLALSIKSAMSHLLPHPEGIASFYWQDQMTANGERFDKRALTAAHKHLPFNTRVRVTHIGNGRSVVVRINDRGPFKPGRIIDLSDAAAEVIGMRAQGLARVRLEVLP